MIFLPDGSDAVFLLARNSLNSTKHLESVCTIIFRVVNVYTDMCSQTTTSNEEILFQDPQSNSEAKASILLENLEEMSPVFINCLALFFNRIFFPL